MNINNTEIISDMHTHTIICNHAYSTLLENVQRAKHMGLSAIAVTEHCCGQGATKDNNNIVKSLTTIPTKIDGVRIYKGAEINIMALYGIQLDLPYEEIEKLDWSVVSYHPISKIDKDVITYQLLTDLYMGLLECPFFMVLGHIARYNYNFDYEKVILAYKNSGRLIELTEPSFSNPETEKFAKIIADTCLKYSAPIVIGSDAHIATDIGKYYNIVNYLTKINFPTELIINSSLKLTDEYIEKFHYKAKQEHEKQKKSFPAIRNFGTNINSGLHL